MERISSNWTLFYKFFLPTFWITFFGAATLAAIFTEYSYVGNIPRGTFQIALVVFFLSGLLALYFTLMNLKRVELGPDAIYVTNYFSHFRYPYESVEKMEVRSFLMAFPANLHLRQAGKFGSNISFLAHKGRLKEYLRVNPEIGGKLRIDGFSV